MKLIVYPGGSLRGETTPPGDKSLSHRAALFAGLATGESCIRGFLVSGVTAAMLRALAALKIPYRLEGDTLTVTGSGMGAWQTPEAALDCGNSATTLRLLAGALAASGLPSVLDGSAGLRRRPMGRIVEPLRAMGVPVEAGPGGGAPLQLGGRHPGQSLRPIAYTLPVASAQVKTCLLLAALAADGPTTLTEPALSRDHSERMLASMGVSLESFPAPPKGGSAGAYSVRLVPPARPLLPLNLTVAGDFSAAAFLLVAAVITPGSLVTLRGVGLNPTRTGLLQTLLEMGANIRVTNPGERHGEPVGDLVAAFSRLAGVEVGGERVVQMIDEFPAFAAAAAYAHGPTLVRQAEELRFKESDRISAVCQELRALGVAAEETPDGFSLPGAGEVPGGATIDPHGDHRLAMALAVAGLAAGRPVTVEGAEIMNESFPGFAATLQALGSSIETVEGLASAEGARRSSQQADD